MNVEDFKDPEVTKAKLPEIFKGQETLMKKYHGIEESNGFSVVEVDLDCRFGQARLKDFAWRMAEEFTEATEAFMEKGNNIHVAEEMIDAYHFLVELTILSGLTAHTLLNKTKRDIKTLEEWFNSAGEPIRGNEYPNQEIANLKFYVYNIIESVGCAMNCLKNKPWKQSHMITDKEAYFDALVQAHERFIILMKHMGLDATEMYNLYFKKNKVNQFRQQSNY